MEKNRITTLLLTVVFLTGLCLLLYPKVSNYWNSLHQTREVNQYVTAVESIDEATYAALMREAKEYNRSLLTRSNPYRLTDEQAEQYPTLLNLSETGVMGYIEIPTISVTLPIYHGTSHAVLQTAVGHLEWTSLPVGGESSHCALSGHRGLPSSKLFTDLDKLVVGDVFVIKVLHETLTYEVDRILIVEPEDVLALQVESGQDYCTLITCTPYGINTHRILVRGHRIENAQAASAVYVTADAVVIEPLVVAPILFAGILLIVLMLTMVPSRKKATQKEEIHEES